MLVAIPENQDTMDLSMSKQQLETEHLILLKILLFLIMAEKKKNHEIKVANL